MIEMIVVIKNFLNISDTAEKIVEGGNDTGAPSNPQIFKKFLITILIRIG